MQSCDYTTLRLGQMCWTSRRKSATSKTSWSLTGVGPPPPPQSPPEDALFSARQLHATRRGADAYKRMAKTRPGHPVQPAIHPYFGDLIACRLVGVRGDALTLARNRCMHWGVSSTRLCGVDENTESVSERDQRTSITHINGRRPELSPRSCLLRGHHMHVPLLSEPASFCCA